MQSSLFLRLIKVKEYLAIKAAPETIYSDLIAEIDSLLEELSHSKPKIKFVSSDLLLSKQLKKLSEQDCTLKQQYQLQITSLDLELKQILCGGEFILLGCQRQQQLSANEQRLIQQAINHNVGLAIIIIDNLQTDITDINSWLEQQPYQFPAEVIFLSHSFLIVTDGSCVKQYQHSLAQLFPTASIKLEARLSQKIIRIIDQSIRSFNQKKRQNITAQQELSCPEHEIEFYRRQIRQSFQKASKLQQRFVQEIKREINHSKANLINPFAQDNLIYETQKIIGNSEIKISKCGKQSYLVPSVKISNIEKKLHLYLANFYQVKFQDYLVGEWEQCNNRYANGGLGELRKQIVSELKLIAHLCSIAIKPKLTPPEFLLSDLAYLPILEAESKLIFDYHFSDSQWFRLFISACIGLIIFLATKFFLGEGRFFGFIIIVFQFINLFTGRDAKTIKLKQQTKELKRILDNKYQVLIRLSAEKIVRDLHVALEDEQRFYQQQIDAISKTVNEKLSTHKKTIDSEQQQINQLKQDRQYILSILRNY